MGNYDIIKRLHSYIEIMGTESWWGGKTKDWVKLTSFFQIRVR